MFVINEQQYNTFQQASKDSYIVRVDMHLRSCFKNGFGELEKSERYNLIKLGIKKATAYGFDSEKNTVFFISLMIVFGETFDIDNQWSQTVLADPKMNHSDVKIDALFDAGVKHSSSSHINT